MIFSKLPQLRGLIFLKRLPLSFDKNVYKVKMNYESKNKPSNLAAASATQLKFPTSRKIGGCLDPLLCSPLPLFNRLQRLLKVPVVYDEGVKKIILMYISSTVSALQRQFYVTYKSYISGSDNKVVDNTNPESCASSCLSESSFICRSFEFDNSTSTCHMSTESTVTSKLASSSNSRFFELSKYEVPDNIFYITKSVLALLLVNNFLYGPNF